ncbi:MAG: acyl-ACP--UDP-N-acetylglucosamine O-acyltransferase [Verrucomicrobiae bacterium]|nr:acyl-ACP--UDP-N-acetylglucosamine O-acyltransferase [Verrucomicrobiae bacterium]MCP5541654.1 acyl-ACP--UDP-N-acetylglucosamine O-acyltransferase [Akkermansiaceae bacterium]MCP5549299.1 acyl-ACP--UDP-N-acetylglucosamine O-acyltransferase [Akkermansiaceae bacterium]
MPSIHPSAIVDAAARIAEDVHIGPYAIVEGPVRLGEGCRLGPHAQLIGDVKIGPRTVIGPGAIIGADPQSVKFDPATPSRVEIGPENTIREYVTIHRSERDGGVTRVGTRNFIMTGAHLAHDVWIGDDNVIANNCLLAGHVRLGDRAFLGGGSVFHQFVRVGDLAMIQGGSRISLDVPPFLMGCHYNRIAGLNAVGMRRAGLSPDERAGIKRAFKILYCQGLGLPQALRETDSHEWPEAAKRFLAFFREESHCGCCLKRNGAD